MKLSNVMVASNGKAKLVDFGLATMSETSDDKLLAAPNARSIDYVALERGTGVRRTITAATSISPAASSTTC